MCRKFYLICIDVFIPGVWGQLKYLQCLDHFSIHPWGNGQRLLKIYCFIQNVRIQISSISATSPHALPCCCVQIITILSELVVEIISCVLWYTFFFCLVYFYFELVTKEYHRTFPFINHGTWKTSTWLHDFLRMTVLEYISRRKKCPFTMISRICADQLMSDLDCLLLLIRFRPLAKSRPVLIALC